MLNDFLFPNPQCVNPIGVDCIYIFIKIDESCSFGKSVNYIGVFKICIARYYTLEFTILKKICHTTLYISLNCNK